jgi:hypothetical protein
MTGVFGRSFFIPLLAGVNRLALLDEGLHALTGVSGAEGAGRRFCGRQWLNYGV